MWILFLANSLFNVNDHIMLNPWALKNLDLNRLSLYPLAHLSIVHILFNTLSLSVPLMIFERQHGTVHTAIILNLLAVITAVLYCLLGMVLFPQEDTAGSSGWCFSLFGYFSYMESKHHPSYNLFSSYSLPTKYLPVLLLLFVTIMVPGSSFWGHALGLLVGYALAVKESWFEKLVPPRKIIIAIESKLDRLINLIPFGIKYYREQEVDRSEEYISIYSTDVLPLTNNESVPFQGQGRVLGGT